MGIDKCKNKDVVDSKAASQLALAAHVKGLIKSWCECLDCSEETTQQITSHGLGIYWLLVQQEDKKTKEEVSG